MPILTAAERIGTTLAGKYRLDRILGAGGVGTVFGGVHAWTGRQVAVKMLNPDYAADAVVAQRFLLEARAAARLAHPNVVDVLDMGQAEDGAVYLVLELMAGAPLTKLVARGPMTVEDTLARLLPVIDALAAAHAHGIVHRDLKPDNIFLSLNAQGREVPKLLDFGIAKVAGNTANTGVGLIVGTPQYMSPEQALGKVDLGPASDVWSMGVVLFECLTGKLPFEAESPTGTLVAIVTQRAPGVGTVGVEVPSAIARVIDRSLLPDPLERFAHAGELAKALQAAANTAGLASAAVAPKSSALPETGSSQVSAPHSSDGSQASGYRATGSEPGPVPAPATQFTWAKREAVAVRDAPNKRILPWLVAGGAVLFLGAAAVVVGLTAAAVTVGAEVGGAQGDAGTVSGQPAAGAAVPATVPPVVPGAMPVVLRSNVGAPLGAGGAVGDGGQGIGIATPPAARSRPARGNIAAPVSTTAVVREPPRVAPRAPVPAEQPGPRVPARRPSSERGANGSLILD